jgi:hypothetical protein
MVAIGTALVNLISLRRDVFEGRTAAIALRAADLVAILRAQDTLGAFAAQDCTTTQQALLGFCGTHNLVRSFGLGVRECLQSGTIHIFEYNTCIE